MATLTIEQKKAILNSKLQNVITAAGKYQVKCNNITLYTDENGKSRYIINTNAMTQYHVQQAISLWQADEHDEALQQNITLNARVNSDGQILDFLPTKNETFFLIMDEITTKQGITGLFPISAIPMPVTAKKAFSLDSLLKTEKEEIVAEKTTEFIK